MYPAGFPAALLRDASSDRHAAKAVQPHDACTHTLHPGPLHAGHLLGTSLEDLCNPNTLGLSSSAVQLASAITGCLIPVLDPEAVLKVAPTQRSIADCSCVGAEGEMLCV